jgi:hypothetical protein
MMDFKGKEALRRRLAEVGGLRAQLARTEGQLQSLLELIGPGRGMENAECRMQNEAAEAEAREIAHGSARGLPYEPARRDGTLPSGSRSEQSPAGRAAHPPRKQAPRLRSYDAIGGELRRNGIAERARARAAAATQPR